MQHDAIPGIPRIALFGRFILVCDKAMRSASLLIMGRQPEDSAAITRRALEAAKTALAIKLNNVNAVNWLRYEDRKKRWDARLSKEKPKFLKITYENLKGDPLIDQIDELIAVLSDSSVHFTPEFYDALDWEAHGNADGVGMQIFLNYFQPDDREIERHYLQLASAHGLIWKAFDRCLDGRLTSDDEVRANLAKFWKTAEELRDDYQTRYEAPIIE